MKTLSDQRLLSFQRCFHFPRQVPSEATRDGCLILQQALNLASQILLLGDRVIRGDENRFRKLVFERGDRNADHRWVLARQEWIEGI